MTYVPHYRLTYSGVFGSSTDPYEDWSFSFAYVQDSGPFVTLADMTTMVGNAASRWLHIRGVINSVAVCTRVRLAAIAADGRYERDVQGRMLYADSISDRPGTATGALAMPLQISCAVSLSSALDEPTGRGRFFLPAPQVGTLDADGRMSAAARDGIQAAAVDFLTNVNADLSLTAPGGIVIASQGSVTRGIAPANRPVTGVSVGRRLDTQRRRAADLAESRDVVTAVAF